MADQTTIDMLIEILNHAELFPGGDGGVYARFELHGERVMYSTASSIFRMWLNRQALETGLPMPSGRAIEQALAEVEHKARSAGYFHPVCGRFFSDSSSIFINLTQNKVLEILPSGYEIVNEHWPVFPDRPGMLGLPAPVDGQVLDILTQLLGLDARQTLLVLAWVMALLQPEGHIPTLIITGPAASGKTRLASAIRYLVDPSKAPILPLPTKPIELERAAADNAILAFDDVRILRPWLVEHLLALGGGTPMRDPETGTMVQRKVPTILVCDEPFQAGELARDAIILRLKDRLVAELKTKSSLELELRNGHPEVIGAIAGLAAKALAAMSSISLEEVHKDASLEKWLLAIETALNLEGELMAAYRDNGAQALSEIVEAHPPVQAFRDMLQAKGSVTATPTDMLALVEPFLARGKGPRWPTSGKGFTTILKRHLYALPDVEIEFDVRTGKPRDRNIVATWRGVERPETKKAKRIPKPSSPGASEPGDQLSLL